MPFNFTTFFINASATTILEKLDFRGVKCLDLDYLSTTTKIIMNPLDISRDVIKSIEISSLICCVICSGWSNPFE